jgi:4-diphosphocytidyl-2-C-methyl-D-erythritol kinase
VTRFAARAPGKVNVSLFVGAPRADGLHPLVSVVQAVSLADELTLEPADAGTRPAPAGDVVRCPGVEGPNLAGRALAAFREATGWDAPPQLLTIDKRVPVAAGMGGGSGDAAAALRLAAHASGLGDAALLHELAARLGADVPSQLKPGRVLMTGAGEHVRPLPGAGPLGIVIVPSEHGGLSTPDVYREFDRLSRGRPPAELAELEAASDPLPAELVHNDLEAAALSLCPPIRATLRAVAVAGASHALVSGSGPTVFGLFPGPDGPMRARAAAARLGAVAAEPVGPAFAEVRAL